ncbi:MAG: HPr family phosphocarrier protein [Thermodesulforhabdaceae bacterium]
MDNGGNRVEKEFLVTNKQGIHARVAAQIVDVAQKFNCEIWISKGNRKVSAKSILDVLTLACGYGSKVLVIAEGPEAKTAVDALGTLFKKRFGET